jgi:hypothetical protein|tara:strand:- start:743 stop:955 length:213 start_codon:yes stop_codon:yes gene_type:complete
MSKGTRRTLCRYKKKRRKHGGKGRGRKHGGNGRDEKMEETEETKKGRNGRDENGRRRRYDESGLVHKRRA